MGVCPGSNCKDICNFVVSGLGSVCAVNCKSLYSSLTYVILEAICQHHSLFSCIYYVDKDSADRSTSPPLSCLDDASTLLGLILKSATKKNEIEELKIPELLALWSDLISDWHGWEEMEDLAVFDCIQEAVNLQRRCDSTNFLLTRISSRVSPGVDQSIIEGVSAFVTKGIMAYPSATWRACSCVHELLHVPSFSFQMQCVKQSIITSFTQAAFSHFKDLRNKPTGLWKPLLLVISSCYILCPEIVEQVLDRDEDNGFMIVACGLAHVSSRSFDSGISSVSEIKLAGKPPDTF